MGKGDNKLKRMLNWYHGFDEKILNFRENGWVPAAHQNPKQDGWYNTIRVGFSGIYSTLNQYANGEWQIHCLDNSYIIAFGEEPVQVPDFDRP